MVFEIKQRKFPFKNTKESFRDFVRINTPGGPKEMAIPGHTEEREGKLRFIQMVVDVGVYEYRRTYNKGAFGSWSIKRRDGKATRVANKTILTSDVIKDVKNRLGAEVAFDVFCQIQEVDEDIVGFIAGRLGAEKGFEAFCHIQDREES